MSSAPITARDVSIVIVTAARSECIPRCLECLSAQTDKPREVIVVDSSADTLTQDICADWPAVRYIRTNLGFGHMTTARNIGIKASSGKVIAFIDDDAFAHPDWLEQLVTGYCDSTVGAVGGRALNNQPGEETAGVHEIGRLKRDGALAGNFAADPGSVIDVDHIIGCNMSFRREVIAKLGGFRDDYSGLYSLCEDTDMCLRVGAIGYRLVFVPTAVVLHIGAPQFGGRRFDHKWVYFAARNYTCMLIRHFGAGPLLLAHMLHSTKRIVIELAKRIGGGIIRTGAHLLGLASGIADGITMRTRDSSAVRSDDEGLKITAYLNSLSEGEKDVVRQR